MNLLANPIFLTQRRLAHRGGVVAMILIALLVGCSLLSALAYDTTFDTTVKTGSVFYAWLVAIQALILIVGGFSRISRTLVEERQNGLLDSNRLTPLRPGQLVIGYWLGPALREFYMALVLSPVGLAMVVVAKLPLLLWVGTQVLLLSSALFFGLLAVLAGMAMPRAQGGVGAVAILPILLPFTVAGGRFALPSFLLPIYATVQLFPLAGFHGSDMAWWTARPQIFGWSIPSLVLTFGLQWVIGLLLWRAAVRKLANPSQTSLPQPQALLVFTILVFLQHGLVWDQWRGAFPVHNGSVNYPTPMLSFVHGGILLLGISILIATSLLPERARLAALRLGTDGATGTFRRSGTATAGVLATIASLALLTQCARNLNGVGPVYVLAAANLFLFFLAFSLSLELCRLRFRRRAVGFFALVLCILWGLPFLLSLVFTSEIPLRFSILTPGVVALANPGSTELILLYYPTLVQLGIVVILLLLWFSCWRAWFHRVGPSTPQHPEGCRP